MDSTFRATCRVAIHIVPARATRAARMNSRSRSDSTCPRMRRVYQGQKTTASASTVCCRLGPSVAAIAAARMNPGKARNRSVTRMTISSARPPARPDTIPSAVPNSDRQRQDDDRDLDRDAGADQHPAEQVPPEVVGAEPVVDRRGLEHGEQVDLVRVLRRDERAEQPRAAGPARRVATPATLSHDSARNGSTVPGARRHRLAAAPARRPGSAVTSPVMRTGSGGRGCWPVMRTGSWGRGTGRRCPRSG